MTETRQVLSDLVERLLRWADSDDNTILGKRKPDPTCLKRQAAARITELETALAEAEGRVKAITIALHDAIRRPMGQVPESADPFYSPAMAEQAEARRVARSQALSELAALASDPLLDRQGKEGV